MIITQAPLRVSFFGGGTDYPEYFVEEGGAVLGAAIDKHQVISAHRFLAPMFDYRIRLAYSRVETVQELEEIQHVPFREALRHCGLGAGVEVHTVADLPAFTGLGSSSSFTVALLQALHGLSGTMRGGLDLAYEAIYLERHRFGDSVGCQDQAFAALGGFQMLEFRAEDHIVAHRVALAPARLADLEDHLILFFTGVKRSAKEIAARQLQRVGLNRPLLRQLRGLVDEGWAALTGGQPLSGFGELLHRGWMLKRDLDEAVSNPVVDRMYATALEAGALGGKLLGAGGGGFLLLFVPPERQAAVTARLGEFIPMRVGLGAPGAQVLHAEKPATGYRIPAVAAAAR